MDTVTSTEKVTGNGPTQLVDVRNSQAGIVENQMEEDMKIVDNCTKQENGTTLIVIQNLHLFVNMVRELRRFANLYPTSLVMVESYMKLLQRN